MITQEQLQDLKRLRDYFLTHDETPFEHWAYSFVNNLLQQAKTEPGNHITIEDFRLKTSEVRGISTHSEMTAAHEYDINVIKRTAHYLRDRFVSKQQPTEEPKREPSLKWVRASE